MKACGTPRRTATVCPAGALTPHRRRGRAVRHRARRRSRGSGRCAGRWPALGWTGPPQARAASSLHAPGSFTFCRAPLNQIASPSCGATTYVGLAADAASMILPRETGSHEITLIILSMSISYQETGRTSQKGRTRDAPHRRSPEAPGGRRHAHRRTGRGRGVRRPRDRLPLLPQPARPLTATFPEIEQVSLLGDRHRRTSWDRLEILVEAITRQAVEHEPELRSMLRLSLDPDRSKRGELPLRKGRRIVWVGDALGSTARPTAGASDRPPRVRGGIHRRYRQPHLADRRRGPVEDQAPRSCVGPPARCCKPRSTRHGPRRGRNPAFASGKQWVTDTDKRGQASC